MPIKSFRPLAICAAAAMLNACGDQADVPALTERSVEPRVFGAEEKAAARALSLGDSATLANVGEPAERAALCVRALASIEKVVAESGAMTDDMMRAMRVARGYYENQIDGLGTEPKSTELTEGSQDQSKTRGELARIGLACLQRLGMGGR